MVIPPVAADGKRHFDSPEWFEEVLDVATLRTRPEWIDIPDPINDIRCVDIGGGNKVLRGWERLDWPEWKAGDAMPYVDNTIDAFFSAHALDHMTGEEVVVLLQEVDRCLRPGGTFTIVVPHHMSTLAHECIEHKSQFGLKTWRNILANPAYSPHFNREYEWAMLIGYNMIIGLEERNLMLVTQLIKEY